MANDSEKTQQQPASQSFKDYLINIYMAENPGLSKDAAEHKAIKHIMNLNNDKRVREAGNRLQGSKVLEAFQTVGIDTQQVVLTDNLTDNAFEGLLHDEDLQPVLVNKQKGVYIYANILQEIEKDKSISFATLNAFDKVVFETVLSLNIGGHIAISYNQIARFMAQKERIRPTSEIIKQIKESIWKMASMQVIIDVNNEAIAHNIPLPDTKLKGIMMDHLLAGRVCNFKLNDEEVGGIVLYGPPILYEYVIWKANGKNAQISRSDPKYLSTPINKNMQTITLQSYLKERIDLMQTRKNMSRVIKLDTIIKKIDSIKPLEDKEYPHEQLKRKLAKQREKIIKQCRTILDAWTVQKYIKGYQEKRGDSNTIESFVITTDIIEKKR